MGLAAAVQAAGLWGLVQLELYAGCGSSLGPRAVVRQPTTTGWQSRRNTTGAEKAKAGDQDYIAHEFSVCINVCGGYFLVWRPQSPVRGLLAILSDPNDFRSASARTACGMRSPCGRRLRVSRTRWQGETRSVGKQRINFGLPVMPMLMPTPHRRKEVLNESRKGAVSATAEGPGPRMWNSHAADEERTEVRASDLLRDE